MLLDIRKEGDVISLKMGSGEELIGSYISDDSNYYTIDRPVCLNVGPKGTPALVPYLMTVSPDRARNLKINKLLVVTTANTDKELADQYNSALSGIAVAPQGFRV